MAHPFLPSMLCATLILAAPPAASPQSCEVREGTGEFVPVEVPGGIETRALGINARGDVVGGFVDPAAGTTRAYLLRRGEYTVLNLGECTDAGAYDISPSGRIVGTCNDAEYNSRLFVWENGAYELFPIAGVAFPTINASGTIAGSYTDPTDPLELVHGSVYTDHFERIDYPGSEQTVVRDIDAAGRLLLDVTFPGGARAHFIKSGDRYEPISFCTDLGTLEPRALLPGGGLVGWIDTVTSLVGFSWDQHTLTTISYPGSRIITLFSANPAGYVVGEAYLDAELRYVSFVYVPHPAGGQ